MDLWFFLLFIQELKFLQIKSLAHRHEEQLRFYFYPLEQNLGLMIENRSRVKRIVNIFSSVVVEKEFVT